MSHAIGADPYPDVVKVREPVARPLDVVAVEMLLSASQAFLAGVMMYLAVGIWNDRGVAVGPVAVILGLLAIAVGGGWLYWLLGGTGWPLAAANVPTSMFLGFALILGWQGDGLIRLDTLPLVLALSASVFGVVAGVFLDSPRRWRWDQRQKLRPGTAVPRISDPTRAAVARVPRSLPSRTSIDGGPTTAVVAASGSSAAFDPTGTSAGSKDAGMAYRPGDLGPGDLVRTAGPRDGGPRDDPDTERAPAPEYDEPAGDEYEASLTPSSFSPKAEPAETAAKSTTTGTAATTGTATTSSDRRSTGTSGEGIELPTSIEPKAQRSPWAWAAPPEWTRDEDDDANGSRPASKP